MGRDRRRRMKKIIYSTTILTVLAAAFLLNPTAALREMLVAQEIYYRGEYLITTYYPAPYAQYQNLVVMGKVGIGTTEPNSKLHIVDDEIAGDGINNDGDWSDLNRNGIKDSGEDIIDETD